MSSVDHCPSCGIELCDCYESVPWDRYKAVFDRSAGLQDRNVKKAQEIAELKAEVERLQSIIVNAIRQANLADSDCCSYHADAINELSKERIEWEIRKAQKEPQ